MLPRAGRRGGGGATAGGGGSSRPAGAAAAAAVPWYPAPCSPRRPAASVRRRAPAAPLPTSSPPIGLGLGPIASPRGAVALGKCSSSRLAWPRGAAAVDAVLAAARRARRAAGLAEEGLCACHLAGVHTLSPARR